MSVPGRRPRPSTDPAGPLDERLVDALGRLARAERAHARRMANGLGLSVLQTHVLEELADGPVPVGRLAAVLGVRQPTVSDAVEALVRKGLVERRAGTDGRSRLVALRPSGRRLVPTLGAVAAARRRAVRGCEPRVQAGALEVVLRSIAELWRAGAIGIARTCVTCRHFEAGPGRGRPRCALLGEALPPARWRLDCPDHEAAA